MIEQQPSAPEPENLNERIEAFLYAKFGEIASSDIEQTEPQ